MESFQSYRHDIVPCLHTRVHSEKDVVTENAQEGRLYSPKILISGPRALRLLHMVARSYALLCTRSHLPRRRVFHQRPPSTRFYIRSTPVVTIFPTYLLGAVTHVTIHQAYLASLLRI